MESSLSEKGSNSDQGKEYYFLRSKNIVVNLLKFGLLVLNSLFKKLECLKERKKLAHPDNKKALTFSSNFNT